MEGTEKVNKNRYDFLISRYKAFKSLPSDFVLQIYKRIMLLLNEPTIHGRISVTGDQQKVRVSDATISSEQD